MLNIDATNPNAITVSSPAALLRKLCPNSLNPHGGIMSDVPQNPDPTLQNASRLLKAGQTALLGALAKATDEDSHNNLCAGFVEELPPLMRLVDRLSSYR